MMTLMLYICHHIIITNIALQFHLPTLPRLFNPVYYSTIFMLHALHIYIASPMTGM